MYDKIYFAFSLLLGVVFGSFFNVVVSRPDWYKGRSRCDNCHHTLAWYDLIPIISYTTLLGKCRYCKKKIPPTHLYAELLCLVAGGTLFLACRGMDILNIICCVITVFVLAFDSVSDMDTQTVFVLPIYVGTVIVAILKGVMLWHDKEFLLIYASVFALFTIICIALEKPAKNYVGDGDLEMYPLIFLTSPYLGVIILTSTLFLYLKRSTMERLGVMIYNHSLNTGTVQETNEDTKDVTEETAEKGIANRRIAFFPVMFILYLVFLFIRV